MKVSVNSIKYMDQRNGSGSDPAPEGVEKLAEKIGSQLGAIEEIIDIGSKYEGIIIVKVMSCTDHPNADRLHICKVDDGRTFKDVERDENGYVQIICGAPNVHEGMLAAWLPPGSVVPSTVNKDPFVLESRAIRGQTSNGMMASARELAIGDDHEGILEVDKDVPPGSSFAETYELTGDNVLDIENKMFTHRPDCFGFLGVARELAGIQGQSYKSPDWYKPHPEFPATETEELKLEVRNDLPDLVPRFTAITMRGVKVGPSPVTIQIELAKVGLRPINNIVDYTNFFMLETGQPLHAYDYDKVVAQDAGADHATIVVRKPEKGEKILLLNGKEVTPRAEAIMIATRDKAIGLGGVMGGSNTEVDENTKNIIIECANFDMYSIRRTSMEHGLFTDAVTRFTKGQSPLQNLAVLARIVSEIRKYAGGKVAGTVIDDNHLAPEVLKLGAVHAPVTVSVKFINERLGLNLNDSQIMTLLKNVEFQVESTPVGDLKLTAPFWRTDIEIPEDIVEEVGRLYGYDKLPLELPKRDLTPAPRNAMLEVKVKIRERLCNAGADEVLTYSFVHGNLLDKVGQDKTRAFQLANALSPDLQYYRLSLIPSLLDRVHPNIKAGFDEFALFEIGKAHQKDKLDDDELPKEFERVAFVFAAEKKAAQNYAGAPYFQTKKYLMSLLELFGLEKQVTFETLIPNDPDSATPYYEPARAATVKAGDSVLGRIGEFKVGVRRALKLPEYCAGFELGLDQLLKLGKAVHAYTPLPRFPKVTQDITLKVANGLSFDKLHDFVAKQLDVYKIDNSLTHLQPLDIFQRDNDNRHLQVTFRYTVANYERTLTDAEVAAVLDKVAVAAKDQLEAERV